MTPAARVDAAIHILDRVLADAAAEQCLTAWARQSRFAGSGDRAAVRDLVYDALRKRASLAWIGGAETGRGLMIGLLREDGRDPAEIFTGQGHAPAPMSPEETIAQPPIGTAPEEVRRDCPGWLMPLVSASLGDLAGEVLDALRVRAPVFLRVNAARATPDDAIRSLAEDGIEAAPGPLSPTALIVTGNPRRIQASRAYREGLVELQDAASQAVVDMVLPYAAGREVLDYCAGGGGKALHLAAGGAARVLAHDADPARMRDIPARADRAGATIEIASRPSGLFDCVLTDVPCSGSGAWRRQPEAKWRLTPERLAELNAVQDEILRLASDHVRDGGVLAYVTCSLLDAENGVRVDAFLSRHPGWRERARRRFTPLDGGDGFFVAILEKRQE